MQKATTIFIAKTTQAIQKRMKNNRVDLLPPVAATMASMRIGHCGRGGTIGPIFARGRSYAGGGETRGLEGEESGKDN
jgi:hypothetical protein